MSLRAITEFILHLEHFRNVDLIQQGLYFMKFQVFNEKEDKIFWHKVLVEAGKAVLIILFAGLMIGFVYWAANAPKLR